MKPERDQYQTVLESLADGTDVDWAALESSAATTAERRRYRNLRLVARVAELHRTLPLDDDGVAHWSARDDIAAASAPATWGHLEIRNRLASGSYGEVYVAHDTRLNVDVALKLLRFPATGAPIDHLLSEARTLAKVRHPNVVTIHGADVRDGRAGLWMDLVDGQTLEAWLHKHGKLGAGEASAIGVYVCHALAAVHAAGLVHGDVKAQNVMRDAAGRIVLMDFGAGRAQGADAVGVAGTPMYLAPEVLAGGPPTPRSDIYSVGVLLFHLLTGAYPCTAVDLPELRAAHANAQRVWLRDLRADLPNHLVDAIERALDADPAHRFATVGEMERAIAGVPAAAGIRRVLPLIAASVFIALASAVMFWARPGGSRRGAVLTEVRTIGVLPMVDLTGSALPEQFVDGLTDELVATLGEVRELTVKPAASAGQKELRPIAEIARALDVDAVLETTLSPAGDVERGSKFRVRTRLIAAGTQGVVWTHDFDRSRGTILELPGAIATTVAQAVNAALTPRQTSRLGAPHQMQPAAEEAYLQGRAYLMQYGTNAFENALKQFDRVLQLDSTHAGAHSGAAVAYIRLGLDGGMAHARARANAVREVSQALNIDPDLSEAYATLAHIRFIYDWEWPEAEREFRRAIELNPNSSYARMFYADDLAAMRRFDESLSQGEMARRLEPQSGAAARRYALFLYYKHDFGAAKRALEDARAVEPNNPGLPLLESRVAEAEGRYDEALDLATRALELSGGGGVPLRVHKVRLQILAGHRAEADESLKSLDADASAGTVQLTSRDRAFVQLALGNVDVALHLWGRAVDERDPTVVWLGVDPRLDGLQHDPRLRELLRVIGIPLVP